MNNEQNSNNADNQQLNIADVSGSLFDAWVSKLEYANKHGLVVFSFRYENKTYLSEWRKAKWCEPYQIAEL